MLNIQWLKQSQLYPLTLLLGLASTLSSCSSIPEATVAPAVTKVTETTSVDDRPFEMDTLYALMVAEMAGDRHRFDIMLSNYVQQAEATHDIGVIARAARLARYLKAHPTALDMGLLWSQLDPTNKEAHYIAAAELVHANRLIEAMFHAKVLIESNETSGLDAIGARAQQGGDITVTKQLLSEFESLVELHPNHHELLVGLSLLYQHAGQLEQALSYVQKASSATPDDFQAKALETRILHQLGRTEEALAKLKQLVLEHPQNPALRLQYARSLLKTDLTGALEQFTRLMEADPNNADITLTLALIEYEKGLLKQAKEHFESLNKHARHGSAAQFYLGRIALTHKQPKKAVSHLLQVVPGVNFLPAQSLISDIYISLNQAKNAIAHVRALRKNTPAKRPKQTQGLFLLESRILSTQGQFLESIALLKQAIEQFPKASRLIYSRAMLFTRINEPSNAEQDLKRVIELNPNNAAALNALGYTLADRTDRVEEAYQYIQRAYALTPDDPAVIDSLGWVEFRRGNHKQALANLRHAMQAMPDHEIAAHLGEVLWATGQTKQAKEIWQSGLRLNPNSPIIHSTIKRLKASPSE